MLVLVVGAVQSRIKIHKLCKIILGHSEYIHYTKNSEISFLQIKILSLLICEHDTDDELVEDMRIC